MEQHRAAEQRQHMEELLRIYGLAYLPPDRSDWQPPGTRRVTGKITLSPDCRLVTLWGNDGSLIVAFSDRVSRSRLPVFW